MAASTHPSGIEYPALDRQPVRLVFCLLGDANTTADPRRVLRGWRDWRAAGTRPSR